jgi:GNAT superfamily N-acetyltransferase
MTGLTLRRAAEPDADSLADLRIEFMKIVKNGGLEDEEGWREGLRGYFGRAIRTGRIIAWLCLDGSRVVGTTALRLDRMRRGRAPAGSLEGCVMSVYTVSSHRRRGVARALLGLALEEARRRGLRRLVLHPTEDGESLYETLGFRRFRTVMILPLLPEAGKERAGSTGGRNGRRDRGLRPGRL